MSDVRDASELEAVAATLLYVSRDVRPEAATTAGGTDGTGREGPDRRDGDDPT
jgi:hypothetical protein